MSPKLILAKPPKPVNEMSQAERRAWAKEIFDAMKAQRHIVDAAVSYLKAQRGAQTLTRFVPAQIPSTASSRPDRIAFSNAR